MYGSWVTLKRLEVKMAWDSIWALPFTVSFGEKLLNFSELQHILHNMGLRWRNYKCIQCHPVKGIMGSYPLPTPESHPTTHIPSPLEDSSTEISTRLESFPSPISQTQFVKSTCLTLLPVGFLSTSRTQPHGSLLACQHSLLSSSTTSSFSQLSIHPGQWHQIRIIPTHCSKQLLS